MDPAPENTEEAICKGLKGLKTMQADADWERCNKLIENILAYEGETEHGRLLTSLSVSEAVVTALTIDHAYGHPVTGDEAVWENCFHILCRLGNNTYGRARHNRLDLTNIASLLTRLEFNDPRGVVCAMRFLAECFIVVNRRHPFNAFETDWSRHPILFEDNLSELALRCVFTGVCTVFRKRADTPDMPHALFHVCMKELFHANRECALEALNVLFDGDFYCENGSNLLTDRLQKLRSVSFLGEEELDSMPCATKGQAPTTTADKEEMYAWKTLAAILKTAPTNIEVTHAILSGMQRHCGWFHIADQFHFKQCVDALPFALSKDKESPEPNWVYSFRYQPPAQHRHALALLEWAQRLATMGQKGDAFKGVEQIEQLCGNELRNEICSFYSSVTSFADSH
jgi:hypothetical protein